MPDSFDSEVGKLITDISDAGLRMSPMAEASVRQGLATQLRSGGIDLGTGTVRGTGQAEPVYEQPQFDRDMSRLADEIVEAANADGATIVTPEHVQEGFEHTEWSFWPFVGGKRGV